MIPLHWSPFDPYEVPPRPPRVPRLVRRLEAALLVAMLLAAGMWSGATLAVDAWRGFPPHGSSDWSEADWRLWREVDALRGPQVEVLRHVENILGPEFAMEPAPTDIEFTSAIVDIERKPRMDDQTGGYVWSSEIQIYLGAAKPESQLWDDHFRPHFENFAVSESGASEHQTATPTGEPVGLLRTVSVRSSRISYQWHFSLDRFDLLEPILERYTAWVDGQDPFAPGWRVDKVLILASHDGQLEAAADLERRSPTEQVLFLTSLTTREGIRPWPLAVFLISVAAGSLWARRWFRRTRCARKSAERSPGEDLTRL